MAEAIVDHAAAETAKPKLDGGTHVGGKIAFLFPGIEPTFEPRVADVAEHFGSAAPPRRPAGSRRPGLPWWE